MGFGSVGDGGGVGAVHADNLSRFSSRKVDSSDDKKSEEQSNNTAGRLAENGPDSFLDLQFQKDKHKPTNDQQIAHERQVEITPLILLLIDAKKPKTDL